MMGTLPQSGTVPKNEAGRTNRPANSYQTLEEAEEGSGAGGRTADHTLNLGAASGSNTDTAAGFAGLFVELASSHFSLDTGVLDQFTKSLDRIVD